MDGGITYLTRQTLNAFKGCPCPVCLRKFVTDRDHIRRPRVLAGCRHVFCAGCLVKLPQPLCPVCRAEFAPPEIDSIPSSQNSQESQEPHSQSSSQSQWQMQSESQQSFSGESDSDPSSQESALSSIAIFPMNPSENNVPGAVINFDDLMTLQETEEEFPSSQASSSGWAADDDSSQPVPESQAALLGSQ